MATSPNGSVKIETDNGRLRIRFTHLGKRYCFALGLPDSKVNRTAAIGKATQIELDMASGHLDPTLKTYKPQRERQVEGIELISLLEKQLAKNFNRADNALLSRLRQWHKPIRSTVEAEELVAWLQKGSKQELKPASLRRYVATLKKLDPEHFGGIHIALPRRRSRRAYSAQQVKAILQFLQQDRYYSHYFDFVKFLLLTGCRTGEAVALSWEQIDFDRREIQFDRSLWRGDAGEVRVKTTKTEEERVFPMNPTLVALLKDRQPEKLDCKALVFPAPKGGFIDSHNFVNRCWRACLNAAGIEWQPHLTTQYKTRHTVISHALEAGVDPTTMAEMAGHRVETLYDFYASSIRRVELPELYGVED
ncbi:MAG: tyrosine-type recombinase/integrase [Cyanobacteriota bacterium]|nr:tyrosine-type recombinase/integrase [Cyanobacteriota bacterium]